MCKNCGQKGHLAAECAEKCTNPHLTYLNASPKKHQTVQFPSDLDDTEQGEDTGADLGSDLGTNEADLEAENEELRGDIADLKAEIVLLKQAKPAQRDMALKVIRLLREALQVQEDEILAS